MLCGGFSQNPYLQKKLAEEIEQLNAVYTNEKGLGTTRLQITEPLYT